jgi:hypothetical protein
VVETLLAVVADVSVILTDQSCWKRCCGGALQVPELALALVLAGAVSEVKLSSVGANIGLHWATVTRRTYDQNRLLEKERG